MIKCYLLGNNTVYSDSYPALLMFNFILALSEAAWLSRAHQIENRGPGNKIE